MFKKKLSVLLVSLLLISTIFPIVLGALGPPSDIELTLNSSREINLKEYYNTGDSSSSSAAGDIDDTIGLLGQIFTANETYSLNRVRLKLLKFDILSRPDKKIGDVTVSIRNTTYVGTCAGRLSYTPTDNDWINQTIDGDSLVSYWTNSSGAWYNITFDQSVVLTEGDMYAIVVATYDASSGTYVYWRKDYFTSSYDYGHYVWTSAGSWEYCGVGQNDFMFELYGGVSKTNFSASWTIGTDADQTILVFKRDSVPSSVDDGYKYFIDGPVTYSNFTNISIIGLGFNKNYSCRAYSGENPFGAVTRSLEDGTFLTFMDNSTDNSSLYFSIDSSSKGNGTYSTNFSNPSVSTGSILGFRHFENNHSISNFSIHCMIDSRDTTLSDIALKIKPYSMIDGVTSLFNSSIPEVVFTDSDYINSSFNVTVDGVGLSHDWVADRIYNVTYHFTDDNIGISLDDYHGNVSALGISDWSDAVEISGPANCYVSMLDLDSDNMPHVVYYTPYGGSTSHIMSRIMVSGSWTDIFQVSSGFSEDSLLPDISVNQLDDSSHVVWNSDDTYGDSGTDFDIFYRNNSGGDYDTWNSIQVVSAGTGYTCLYPSIAVDSMGVAHVAWHYSGGNISYCNNSGGSWNSIEEASPDGTIVDIAVDSNNIPHLVYKNGSDIEYRNKVSGSWSAPVVVSNGGSSSGKLSMYGTVAHVVWKNTTNPDIYYRNNSGGSWNSIEVVSSEATGADVRDPCIDVDSDGNIHVSWSDNSNYTTLGTDRDVCYKMKNNTWSYTELVSTDSDNNTDSSSIKAGSDDKVYAVWIDYSGFDNSVMYSYRTPYTFTDNIDGFLVLMDRDKTRNVYLDDWTEMNSSTITASSVSTYNWTRPFNPISFTVPDIYSTSTNITWDASDDFYSWDKVVIRKSTLDYPASPTDGSVVYNGSGTYVVESGPPATTTYYSTWGYGNESGFFSLRYMTGYHVSTQLRAFFTYKPERIRSGQLVTFYDRSSGGNITSWKWDFGDGTTFVGKNAENRFTTGQYTVSLTIEDINDYQDKYSKIIDVPSDVNPYIPPPIDPMYPEGYDVAQMYSYLNVDSIPKSDNFIRIVVIDTGFTPRVYKDVDMQNVKGYKLKDYDDVYDDNGHGTFCLYQIMYMTQRKCPDAEIISFKAFDENGEASAESFLEALDLIKKMDPDVVSISAGAIGNPTDQFSMKIKELREAGIIVLASAAGNLGPVSGTILSPACSDHAIAVGSYNPINNAISRWSSRGPVPDISPKPDVVAPGESIRGPWGSIDSVKSGTSMSVPFIVGGTAAVVSRHKPLIDIVKVFYFWNKGVIGDAYEGALKDGCTHMGDPNEWGAGIPDFEKVESAFFWNLIILLLIPIVIIVVSLVIAIYYFVFFRKKKPIDINN